MSSTSTTLPVPRRSALLSKHGFKHGFSTRTGGVSEGPFASLNLGRSVGDRPEHVAENVVRFAASVGTDPAVLYESSQVHGADVVDLRGATHVGVDAVRAQSADALIARTAGVSVGVRTADCVPILIGDPVNGTVAAVHAGWRGIVNGIVREAVQKLQSRSPAQLVAAIGPSIGPCCFEVGNDVATRIALATGDGIIVRRGPEQPHVDLWRAASHQLRSEGLVHIDLCTECTMCNADHFFSHRRDGAASGRMLSIIAAK